MVMFGIWCKDRKNNRGDWMRYEPYPDSIVAFTVKRAAMNAAAKEYGF